MVVIAQFLTFEMSWRNVPSWKVLGKDPLSRQGYMIFDLDLLQGELFIQIGIRKLCTSGIEEKLVTLPEASTNNSQPARCLHRTLTTRPCDVRSPDRDTSRTMQKQIKIDQGPQSSTQANSSRTPSITLAKEPVHVVNPSAPCNARWKCFVVVRKGSALCKTKVLASGSHRGIHLLPERFVAFVLWEVKFCYGL